MDKIFKIKNKYQLSWKKFFLSTFLLIISSVIAIFIYLFNLSTTLPSINELNKYNPEQVSKIISADNVVIKKLYTHKRDMVDISNIPKHLTHALIVMEDRDFFAHYGINIKSIIRALIVDILSFSSKQGASTLTQQLARTMYTNKDAKYYIGQSKRIDRKLKELITAIKIERTYTKSEILELYFNSVYFGHGTYGIQAASVYYFGKDVSEITIDESALLIGLLPAPAIYSPINHPERAIKRRNLVLNVMYNNEYLSKEVYNASISKSIPVRNIDYDNSLAPYFSEYIRRELEQIDNDLDINIYEDGLNINTTLDMSIQNILENSFNESMKYNQKIFNESILNNKKKLNKVSKALNISIDSLKIILENDSVIPQNFRSKLLVQGAALAIDPKHGHILGMIGGRNEPEYVDHFNRATQAKRQPGSVFKPFIYLTALESGNSPCTQLLNQPLVFFVDDTTSWDPQNYDGKTGLLTTLRDGIKKSINLISVRIVQELVSPKEVKNTAERFGISTNIRAVDAIALGVSEVIPLDITSAYAAISNNGILAQPLSIISIDDNKGREIKQFLNSTQEVANEEDIYILRDMMKSVLESYGTGSKIRWKYKFYAPAAGKTGTTNKKTDAWFVGFTPQLTIGIWIGLDDPYMSLGDKQYGSNAALPIFANSIKEIYDKGEYKYLNQEVKLDVKKDWSKPDGIIQKNICKESCCLKTEWCDSYKEYFNKDNVPQEQCNDSSPIFRFND